MHQISFVNNTFCMLMCTITIFQFAKFHKDYANVPVGARVGNGSPAGIDFTIEVVGVVSFC